VSLRPTFAAGALHAALAAVEELGVARSKVLARLGPEATAAQDPNTRVPLLLGLKFWKAAEAISRDPLIGLRASRHIGFGRYPLLDFLCAAASTVGEGLLLFSRYVGVVNDAISPRVVDRGSRIEVVMDRRLGFIPMRAADEFHVAVVLHRLKFLTDADPAAYTVTFAHAGSADAESYERVLGVRTVFRAPANAVIIAEAGYLERPPSKQAKLQKDQIFPLVEAVLRSHVNPSHAGGLRSTLHRTFKERSPAGDVGIESVGRRLGMSTRTLQRRLAEAGTGFEDELVCYRKYTAISLLEAGATIDDVAFLLGYRHSNNFIRAFKSWYGKAPAGWINQR
jgi:AraC-like DNA-binding protein